MFQNRRLSVSVTCALHGTILDISKSEGAPTSALLMPPRTYRTILMLKTSWESFTLYWSTESDGQIGDNSYSINAFYIYKLYIVKKLRPGDLDSNTNHLESQNGIWNLGQDSKSNGILINVLKSNYSRIIRCCN